MNRIQPTIHNNGDNAQNLIDQMTDARQALLDAVEAMKAALPHMRNYPTIAGPAFYADDRAEAVRRIEVVQDMAEAYYQDAIALVREEER